VSKSGSAKPEQCPLTLAPKITEGKAGFKQVHIVDRARGAKVLAGGFRTPPPALRDHRLLD